MENLNNPKKGRNNFTSNDDTTVQFHFAFVKTRGASFDTRLTSKLTDFNKTYSFAPALMLRARSDH